MELKNGPVSTFKLLGNSLKIANTAYGAVLGLFVLITAVVFVLIGIAWFISKILNGPLGIRAVSIPLNLLIPYLSVVATVATVKLLGTRFENKGLTVTESFTQSLFPAFYLIIASVIIGIILLLPLTLFGLGLAKTGDLLGVLANFRSYTMLNPAVLGLGGLVISLLFLPFGFILQAIALEDEGPFSAIRYALSLGYRHYFRILPPVFMIMLLGLAFNWGIMELIKIPAVQAAFAPIFLLFLTKSFMGAGLGIALLLSVLAIYLAVCLYIFLFTQAVWTALFLNLGYLDRGTQNRELDSHEETIIDAPQKEHKVQGVPLTAQQPQEPTQNTVTQPITLSATVPPQQQPAAEPAMPAPGRPMPPTPPAPPVAEHVNMTQSSVETHSDDTLLHLNQVFRAQEHLAQAVDHEEDRMPTILFDDEMAQQLAEAEEKLKQQQAQAQQRKIDEGPDSIKMSDKTL